MKEIKAFLHRNRVPDVVHALRQAGLHAPRAHLSVIDVRGTLAALDARERGYSVEAGEPMIAEVKLELICPDERVDEALALIRAHGRTGQSLAGWVFVIDVAHAEPLR